MASGIELERVQICDIRTLSKPQEVVKAALTATALLMGHSEEETKVWRTLMLLLFGAKKEHITETTGAVDPDTVPLEVALAARALMQPYTERDLYVTISSGKAFWQWITRTVDAVLARYPEEEINKAQTAMKQKVDSS